MWALALLSSSNTIEASKESAKACTTAVDILNEHITLQDSFTAMLVGYNSTCLSDGLCVLDVDEDTLYELKNMNIEDKEAPIPAIKAVATAHFGKSFKMHPTFLAYDTACTDAGGILECVDGHMTLLGEAGAAFIKNERGVDTDVDMKIMSYPICLPKECDGEELDKVLENSAKEAILKAPAVAEEMTAQTEAMIKSVTADQLCALSGLDTCKLEVEAVGCQMSGSPALMNTSARFIVALALAGTAIFSLF